MLGTKARLLTITDYLGQNKHLPSQQESINLKELPSNGQLFTSDRMS